MKGSEASAARAFEHVDYLCNVIGDRYVGTDGERRAVEYIASQHRGYGLKEVAVEGFRAPQSLALGFELRVPSPRRARHLLGFEYPPLGRGICPYPFYFHIS